MNKKWGLIDAGGKVVLQPDYDAIGEFKQYGYAVMQRQGRVGLLNRYGREIIAPRYDDLKVLDSTLVAVLELGEWMVINPDGRVILKKGYTKVEVWGKYLAFLQNKKWGIVDRYGHLVAEPRYDEVYQENEFFITRKGEQLGLLSPTGRELLGNLANEIKILNDSLFFYRAGHFWGAVDAYGINLIPAKYDGYQKISDQFIKLIADNKLFIYAINCRKIITNGEFEDYYAFSRKYLITKKKRQLGLIDACGNEMLSCRYHEIQLYQGDLFRVNYQGKWGVLAAGGQVLIDFKYDYIAPLTEKVCVVKKEAKFGLANLHGEEIVAPNFQRIELEPGGARAYHEKPGKPGEEALTLFTFDEDGRLADNSSSEKHFQIKIGGKKPAVYKEDNNFSLPKFEWFYSPVADRWGLRRLEDGAVQIEPKFQYVKVERELGFTLVGIEKAGKYEFERSTYRFDMIYGLVNNDVGLLVTELDFWDLRFDDFYKGYPVARCVFSNGRHGLIDRIGRIVKKDYAYIGDFEDGVARMSLQGKLSGSLKDKQGLGRLGDYLADMLCTGYLIDYTQYDQLFRTDAVLVCEGCQWGYVDTAAQVVVEPQFSFANAFTNNVGIVACGEKWGMINRKGQMVIPCNYDGIRFLEDTDNRIVQVYIQAPKYGLIDTLGQLTVSAIYDEIGNFSEGRLAVKHKGMWGFVNADGLEVIPCRFREVQNFSEGLAAVKLGRSWGFIDKQGNVEIDFKYKKAGNFNEGMAWAQTDSGVSFIDPKDKELIAPKFERAFDFQNGVARVLNNGNFGLIDTKGKYLLKPKFADIQPFDSYGRAVVCFGQRNVRFGIINRNGSMITGQDYLQVTPFQEGLALVRDDKGFGYIDTTGKLVIPCIYGKANPFFEGRAVVCQDGACGYIDTKGVLVIPLMYSKCLDFQGGKAVVYKGLRRAGLIDLQGNQILEPELDRLLKFQEGRGLMRDEKYRFYYITEQANVSNGYYEKATAFKHGVAVVQIDGRWGIINQKGIEIIPPKYDRIESFEGGYAKVRIEGLSGLSNLQGEIIAKPDFEFISYAGQGLFRAEQGDKIGYFDTDGNWIWDLTK